MDYKLNGNHLNNGQKEVSTKSSPCDCGVADDYNCPKFFLKMDPVTEELLFKNKREIKFKAGELIIKQASTLNYIACIKTGYVKQYIEVDSGKSLIYKILAHPHAIGFCDFLNDEPINYSAAAITDTTLCLISINDLKKAIEKNPKLTHSILKYVNGVNHGLLDTLINFTQTNRYQKVTSLLLFFKNEMFQKTTYSIPLSRQELADMCSITKESLIRVLKELKDSGYITVNGNDVSIVDEKALQRIVK